MIFIFFLLALVIVSSGIAVIALRNPVYSALALVLNLTAVSGIFAMLGAHFLAVAQIIVYAGAIMVLFIFVIMLLNVKAESEQKGDTVALLLSGAAALFFVLLIGVLSFSQFDPADAAYILEGTVERMGRDLFTKYLFQFEAASLLIMVAVVGATMLARRSYRDGGVE